MGAGRGDLLPDGTASAAVSRHLARLRELDLVDTAPDGRMTRIFKLFEDGSGDPYTAPPGKAEGSRRDVYFRVPFAYWEQGFHESLSVLAKVMLLICMSMRSRSFVLRQDKKFTSWYGISPSTAGRGIRELQEKELVYPVLCEQHLDGFAVLGQSTRERWALAAPFDLNVNKTGREAAESLWTVEGVARTAARFAAVLPAPPAAAQAARPRLPDADHRRCRTAPAGDDSRPGPSRGSGAAPAVTPKRATAPCSSREPPM